MQLADQLNQVNAKIAHANNEHLLRKESEAQVWIIDSVKQLAEICQLLSTDISDLAAKTAQLADSFDKNLEGG